MFVVHYMENFYGILYSGNAVWGSAPAIDPIKKLVHIATGNNYEVYGLLIGFAQVPLLVNACFKSNDWYFTCDSKCKIWNYMGIECCHSRNNLVVTSGPGSIA
ncbi:hypothetical protein C1646_746576 [Rhizophagus diaphanus]|nr:hypothetical protein C1646_746576 [Rhizophagus diaphanus] [Rhizophagus sp. MUCL 43196]